MLNSVWMKSAAMTALAVGVVSSSLRGDAPGGSPAAVASADWPRFMGPAGTGISQDKIADKWPAGGPKKLWTAKVGKSYSSAVAKDGKLYFFSGDGDKETLTCFDANTGAVAWTQSYKGGYPKDDYPGVRATPTIDGDKIYTFGGAGMLVCRDLKSGKDLWNIDIIKATGAKLLEWGQSSSPCVVGDLVVVQGGDGGAVAAAVDKNTGRGVWESQAKGKAGYAQIIAIEIGGKQQLIVFGGTHLIAMDPANGKTIWQEAWKTSYDVNAATPIYDGQGNLFISSAYNVGAGMFKLTPTGATKAWGPDRKIQSKFQPSILDGKTLYTVADEKRGVIKAVEWPTNKILWEAKDPQMGFGGSIVRVGDKLIAQTQKGEVALLKATPEAGEKISSFTPFEDTSGKVWSMPVVYQGKLYVKGPEELVCYDVK